MSRIVRRALSARYSCRPCREKCRMQCQEGFSGPASVPMGISRCRPPQNSAFRCSGASSLQGRTGPVDLPNKKLAGLLAYLACTAPRPQQREKLSALLWGSHFDAQAKQNLRQALFRLRKVVGQDALQGDGEIVVLNAAAVACDVSRFEELVREDTRESLTAAADLYRGRFMDDIAVSEEGWTEWLAGRAPAAGRPRARRPGAARRTGAGRGPSRSCPEGRPARRRAQQHARRRPSDDHAGAGRFGTQGRSPQALRRPGRASPSAS